MRLTGVVENIRFRNEGNGYTVLDLFLCGEDASADTDTVTVTGNMPVLDPGESVSFEGDYYDHPVYDRQFRMTSFEIVPPKDAETMKRYLSSGAVKGVGKALARRIVDRFGEDTFRIFEEEPERLAEVNGISLRKARKISEIFEQKAEERRAYSFLQQYGISDSLSRKIYETYKLDLYDVIRTNPYKMIRDIDGVGFITADRIAAEAGLQADMEFRVRAGLLYVFEEAQTEGHLCLPEEMVIQKAAELLRTSEEDVRVQLKNLSVEGEVVYKLRESGEAMAYSAAAYYAEAECARRMIDLNLHYRKDREQLEKEIRAAEAKEKLCLEEAQREAVIRAAMNDVLILTGGPGTGKTTTINLMLRFFASRGASILLAAPTGRAARRMSEATGFEAATIHRLLGMRVSEDGKNPGFEKNDENPLEADVLILDEMSMVDIWLFRSLLRSVLPGTKLILVGDENQLPSVGPGSVLKDLIASEAFPVATLTKIYRQSEAGDIVLNAHNICAGRPIRMDNDSRDFFFLKRTDSERIIEGIEYLIRHKLPRYVGCVPEEIQVMAPMKKGPLGVETLNIRLQEMLNPRDGKKPEIETEQVLFRTGDKVMQIKNNYGLEWEVITGNGFVTESGKGVFNGDVGTVLKIEDETVTVRFDDGRQALYQGELFSELELAYAITIHKSQGSEYPAVIIPLLSGPRPLMNRNLLYTAVTRARKCVILMGRREAVEEMIANANEKKRYTGLEDRIREIICIETD